MEFPNQAVTQQRTPEFEVIIREIERKNDSIAASNSRIFQALERIVNTQPLQADCNKPCPPPQATLSEKFTEELNRLAANANFSADLAERIENYF